MTKLFGIPVEALAVVLAAVLGAALVALAVLAFRNRIFLRLGIRNVRRRPARSALIVIGSMLGTAIIAAALATGDTMGSTVRSSAISSLGQADEVVAAKGIQAALEVESGGTPGTRYFPQSYAEEIEKAVAGSGLVDGVAPVIVETVAVQDIATRQNEPRTTLFAGDPESLKDFGEIKSEGKTVSLDDLRRGEVYLNVDAADELDASPGDRIRILAGEAFVTAKVKAIVTYDGGGTAGSGFLLPLSEAQRLLDEPGLVKAVLVSNRGDAESGAGLSSDVIDLMQPTLDKYDLEADNTKEDALKEADITGAAFMSLFTTFGSFSIAAGILLMFLIFVMLAAERRGELGIARAVGTRRGHLIELFLFEGVAYDLVAAAVGVLVGVAVAYGMVIAISSAFGSLGDFEIRYSVKPVSLFIAYAIGMLLTFAVVVFSAWRVSRMNIVTAIRDLPEPPAEKQRRRRWILGLVGLLLGLVVAASGVSSEDAIVLGLGVSVVILSLVPLLHALGLPDRAVHTAAGLGLVLWFVLPISRWLFGDDLKTNFSIFILGGLMLVIGATWTIMYNADLLLGALGATFGRIRRIAPVLRMSMAYPLRSLFRTGVTLAMFTLVVFTLVVGAVTTGSFVHAVDDVDAFGGGFDVRATTSPASPIPDMSAALKSARGVDASDFRVVSNVSDLPVEARQLGNGSHPETYPVHGVDDAFLDTTTYELAATARGYGSSQAVWRALKEQPNLAVVDQMVVPRRSNFNFGPLPPFHLTGFYLEDQAFAPVRVEVSDPQTGKRLVLTVIGVLSDRAPLLMAGIWTSQATLSPVFGDRVLPTTHLFALGPSMDPAATAKQLESAFVAHGMEADSLQKLLDESVSASLTFDRLIMGFMGLGLIVGVAALGVISARSVVERRQQIGVLRAIGFRKRMVQASLLLESSFIAATSIVVGTALGLIVAHNVISDSRRTPSWEHMSFEVPWVTLTVIFLTVYAVALGATLAPAVRASRVYPAEALRYQ